MEMHQGVSVSLQFGLYQCSTKTREALGNLSPKPERFPETQEIEDFFLNLAYLLKFVIRKTKIIRFV